MTDFDPLKMLQELQQGFILLGENQRILNENQQKITQASDALAEAMLNLQTRQDILKASLDLVILAQKTTQTDLHK